MAFLVPHWVAAGLGTISAFRTASSGTTSSSAFAAFRLWRGGFGVGGGLRVRGIVRERDTVDEGRRNRKYGELAVTTKSEMLIQIFVSTKFGARDVLGIWFADGLPDLNRSIVSFLNYFMQVRTSTLFLLYNHGQ